MKRKATLTQVPPDVVSQHQASSVLRIQWIFLALNGWLILSIICQGRAIAPCFKLLSPYTSSVNQLSSPKLWQNQILWILPELYRCWNPTIPPTTALRGSLSFLARTPHLSLLAGLLASSLTQSHLTFPSASRDIIIKIFETLILGLRPPLLPKT